MENVLENSRKDQELIYKAGNMPRPTGIEVVCHIRRRISVNERVRENITIPVDQSSTEAARTHISPNHFPGTV